MGFFDRLRNTPESQSGSQSSASSDDQAIARYRYLVRTAPPEAIEQAHAEAFAQLTPSQRQRLLQELAAGLPDAERSAAWRAGDAPGALARSATRAELREPGTLERAWNRMDATRMGAAPGSGFGAGMGGMFAGSLLGSVAGTVLGTMIAQQFFTHHPEANHLFGSDASVSPAGDLAEDPWRGLDSHDGGGSADVADLGGEGGDLVGGDLGGDFLDV
ncbi:MAG: hypothetical protein U1F54_03685 [Burkholderiales bacterium]